MDPGPIGGIDVHATRSHAPLPCGVVRRVSEKLEDVLGGSANVPCGAHLHVSTYRRHSVAARSVASALVPDPVEAVEDQFQSPAELGRVVVARLQSVVHHEVDEGYILIVMYGSDSNRVKNILAAGTTTLTVHSDEVRLTAPRLISKDEAWQPLSADTKAPPEFLKVTEYLQMDVVRWRRRRLRGNPMGS